MDNPPNTTYFDLTTQSSNVTENNTNATATDDARMVHVIGRPILIVLGTIGNCLTFYVMRKGSLRNVSTCFYMAILALADTGKFRTLTNLRSVYTERLRHNVNSGRFDLFDGSCGRQNGLHAHFAPKHNICYSDCVGFVWCRGTFSETSQIS